MKKLIASTAAALVLSLSAFSASAKVNADFGYTTISSSSDYNTFYAHIICNSGGGHYITSSTIHGIISEAERLCGS